MRSNLQDSAQAALDTLRQQLGAAFPARSDLLPYRPHPKWFLRPASIGSIHGIAHEARVLVWQELLARVLIQEGATLDQEALRWAAVTHDTRRVDDGPDWQHGERAAVWVQQTLQGSIPAASLETVAYLNRWHVPPDASAPAMTPELAVFKDADALDRVRLLNLNLRYLRWEQSQTLLVPLANALLIESMGKQMMGVPPFEAVLAAAQDIGLV